MANTPPRRPDDPYGGMLVGIIISCGLLLAAALWAWPHVPTAWRFPYFLGVFLAYYAIAAGFASLSRAADARARRRARR